MAASASSESVANITSTDDLPPPMLHPGPSFAFGGYKFRAFCARILGEKDVKLALKHLRKQNPDNSISYAWVLEEYKDPSNPPEESPASFPTSSTKTLVKSKSTSSRKSLTGWLNVDLPPEVIPETADGNEPGSGLKLLGVLQRMQVLNTLIVVCTKYRKPQGPSIHTSILNPAVPQNQVFLEMPLDDRLKYIVKAAVSVLPDFVEVMMDIDELAFINEALLLQQTLMATLPPDAARKLLADPATLAAQPPPLTGAVPSNWTLAPAGSAAANAGAVASGSSHPTAASAALTPRGGSSAIPRPSALAGGVAASSTFSSSAAATSSHQRSVPVRPKVAQMPRPLTSAALAPEALGGDLGSLVSSSSMMSSVATPIPVAAHFTSSLKVKRAASSNQIQKPSLQYLLAVPSNFDSESSLDELHAQYQILLQQYAASAERIVERLRHLPVHPRSPLAAAITAAASPSSMSADGGSSAGYFHAMSGGTVDPATLSPESAVLAAALTQYAGVPPLLVELACLDQPVAPVRQTVSAIALLLQWSETSWHGNAPNSPRSPQGSGSSISSSSSTSSAGGARVILLDPTFPLQLCSLDLLAVDPAAADSVRQLLRDPSLSVAHVRKSSEVASVLLEWVQLTVSALNKAHNLAIEQRSAAAPVPATVDAAIKQAQTQPPSPGTSSTLPHLPPVFSTPSNLGDTSTSGHHHRSRGNSPRRGKPVSSIDVAAIAAHVSSTNAAAHYLQQQQPVAPSSTFSSSFSFSHHSVPTSSFGPRIPPKASRASTGGMGVKSEYAVKMEATRAALKTMNQQQQQQFYQGPSSAAGTSRGLPAPHPMAVGKSNSHHHTSRTSGVSPAPGFGGYGGGGGVTDVSGSDSFTPERTQATLNALNQLVNQPRSILESLNTPRRRA